MVHQWHCYRRLLPPPPTARRRLSWVRRLVPPNNDLLATAQPRPTSRRHPGSPFTAALAVRPSFKLGSPECAAKREEDPYLVNIASTRRLATLPRLITLPRARRQDVKDRQGCYLLAALATFGIAFASAIAGHLPYLRRPLRRPTASQFNRRFELSVCDRDSSRFQPVRRRRKRLVLHIQTRLGWHGWWDAALHLGEERNCFLDVRNLASLVESSGQIECQIVEADKMTGRSAEGWYFTKRAIRYTATSAAFVVPLGRLQNTSVGLKWPPLLFCTSWVEI
ncbi:hypothetical protein B0H14DRAFT_3540303 [Mycena olivaceomarginata]|nr:hypothetical protein B0H14DRAFT_3540303 [Mycena olivaceomarginata]